MKKLELNYFSFFAIFFLLFIIINDYFCFIFKTNFNYILLLVSAILTFGIAYLLKKKICLIKPDFCKADIVFFIILFMVLIVRVAIPDSAYDTLNYHLYVQERVFSNNSTFNFFPARWINTYSLPLADRIHFFFRSFLGYRIGIIGNTIFMIIIYYQVKALLSLFVKNKYYISIVSALIIITEQLFSNMITYYVDIFSIPFFLEIIIIFFKNKKVNNITNIMVLFMSGLLLSLKISNAFLLIPLAIIYLIKFRKNINIKTILIGIPIALFPIAIYLINNYIQTGNPVFPFYNTIFHSKYLPDTNWIEDFYGPKRWIERLLWPIYIIFNPRRAFDADYYYGRLTFGYIISLIVFLSTTIKLLFKKVKPNNFDKLNILFIILCLIWSCFMMGYIRYALILEVLAGIVMAIVMYEAITNKKILYDLIGIIAIAGFLYTTFLTMGDMLKGSTEYSWRWAMNPIHPNPADKKNIIKIFSNNNYDKYLKDVDCFGIVDTNSGYAALLSDDKRIIGIRDGYYSKYGKKTLDKTLKKCKNIYTISTATTKERTLYYLKEEHFEKVGNEIRFKTDFIDASNKLIIFEIKKEGENNE